MNWMQALIAGLVQGITEFLPVSSSGHLVILQTLFGESGETDLTFSVFLHLATLTSVVIVYRHDIWLLIRSFFAAAGDLIKGRPDFKQPERRFLLMVIIGTVPAAVAGVSVKLLELDGLLENIFVVAVMLIVTSAFMFLVDRIGKRKYTEADAPYRSALLVGVLQSIAILPGLSRSGTTIFGGLLGGFRKDFAVKFAFILSIPAILGAGLVEMAGVMKTGIPSIDIVSWMIGFAAAAFSGIIAIRFIQILVNYSKFYIFGVYCLLASAVAFWAGLR